MNSACIYKCHLCGRDYTQYVESHITPKLFWNQIKKNGALIRSTDNPNIRKQDGVKLPFFCPGCEELFSKYETAFNNKWYSKITNNKCDYIAVDDDFKKFVYQIIYRELSYTNYLFIVNPHDINGGLTYEEKKLLIDLEEKMRLDILNNTVDVNIINNMRVVFTDTITNQISIHIRDNYCIHGDVRFFNKKGTTPIEAYVIVLVPHLLFIYSVGKYVKLKGNSLTNNVIKKKTTTLPSRIVKWLQEVDYQFLDASSRLSDRQKEVIDRVSKSKGLK